MQSLRADEASLTLRVLGARLDRDRDGLINAENASGVRRLGSIVDGDEHRSAGVVGRSVNSFYFRTLAEVCDERSRPWRAAAEAPCRTLA